MRMSMANSTGRYTSLLAVILLVLLSVSCALFPAQEGALVIVLGDDAAERSFHEPVEAMKLSSYVIRLQGPDTGSGRIRITDTLSVTDGQATVGTYRELVSGDWNISIEGLNGQDRRVAHLAEHPETGRHELITTIQRGATATMQARLVPCSESTGDLSIQLDWQEVDDMLLGTARAELHIIPLDDAAADPDVSAAGWESLEDSPGISCETGADIRTAAADIEGLPSGIYEVTARLTAAQSSSSSWQSVAFARIVDGCDTEIIFELSEERLETGSLQLQASGDFSPLELTIHADSEQIMAGDAVTFSVEGDVSESGDFYWYIDGEAVTTYPYTFSDAGTYSVLLMYCEDDRWGTAMREVQVLEGEGNEK